MAKSKTSPKRAGELYARMQKLAANCQKAYEEIDGIEAELIPAIRAARGSLKIPGGATLALKNNFEDKDGNPRNKAFKTAMIKALEIVAG